MFAVAGLPLFAQDDDCDPNSSMEDLITSKQTVFGPNCMQWAINISMNVNHNRSFNLADGNNVPVFSVIKKKSLIPGGEWATTFRETYSWHGNGPLSTTVFSRPGTITNLGHTIILEFYTLELDTGIIKVDVQNILKQVRNDYSDYDDELIVSVEPYTEKEQQYCKVNAKISLKEGLRPTRVGDMISYFYMWVANHINYQIKYDELDAANNIGKMKFSFWNKSQIGAALKVNDMLNKGSNVKDGQFIWSQNSGAKVIQVDNYGTECLVYFQVRNSTIKINEKVIEELNNWVNKEKPDNAESAEVKLFGETPWLMMKFKIGGKKGSDLFEEIREDVINDWGDDFVEKAEDVVSSLK